MLPYRLPVGLWRGCSHHAAAMPSRTYPISSGQGSQTGLGEVQHTIQAKVQYILVRTMPNSFLAQLAFEPKADQALPGQAIARDSRFVTGEGASKVPTCAGSLLLGQGGRSVQPTLHWECPNPELRHLLLQGRKTCRYGSCAGSSHAAPERCHHAAPAQQKKSESGVSGEGFVHNTYLPSRLCDIILAFIRHNQSMSQSFVFLPVKSPS